MLLIKYRFIRPFAIATYSRQILGRRVLSKLLPSPMKSPPLKCPTFALPGPNSFNFYAVKIFRQTFAGMNPHGGAVAVGFVQLLASMLSGLLIDTVGRIPLLIVSSVFMSLAFACLGSYIYYEQGARALAAHVLDFDTLAPDTAGNNDWIPLLCVLIFTIAFSLGELLAVNCVVKINTVL